MGQDVKAFPSCVLWIAAQLAFVGSLQRNLKEPRAASAAFYAIHMHPRRCCLVITKTYGHGGTHQMIKPGMISENEASSFPPSFHAVPGWLSGFHLGPRSSCARHWWSFSKAAHLLWPSKKGLYFHHHHHRMRKIVAPADAQFWPQIVIQSNLAVKTSFQNGKKIKINRRKRTSLSASFFCCFDIKRAFMAEREYVAACKNSTALCISEHLASSCFRNPTHPA